MVILILLCLLGVLLVYGLQFALMACHDRWRRTRRSQFTHEDFIQLLRKEEIADDVAELVWQFFQGWMIVRYPLKPTDIVAHVVELEDRELLDDLEEFVMIQLGLHVDIPSEFLRLPVQHLATHLDRA